MRILDQQNNELEFPDMEKGRLENDRILVAHHEAVEAVEAVGHWETVAEYDNGGKDVEWIVDVPGVEACEAWDEYEDILRYIPFTETELKLIAYEAKRRPLSSLEALELLLSQQIQTLNVDDNTALRLSAFFPEWVPDRAYSQGEKVQSGGVLYSVLQSHTSLAGWEPENVPSLFARINETNAGTDDDPIPYDGNMILTKDTYYYQDGKLYLCTRDTGVAVFHPLTELVGLYVDEII